MSRKSDLAAELFKQGYNCSQAVLGAFAEELGLNLETALKISAPFGGGMGRMREVCGALTGAFMAAGLKYGYTEITDHNLKSEHYKLIQGLAEEFKRENGSIICRELLNGIENSSCPVASERNGEYYKKRPCVDLVRIAAENLEKLLEGREK